MLINDKKSLRILYSSIRKGIDAKTKEESDRRIITFLVNTDEFVNCEKILVYVSFGSEIKTDGLIDYSLNLNKEVCVPVWNNGQMEFFKINNRNELSKNINGILIPDNRKCEKSDNSENCLCIVPGLSFDKFGNRLGFGGGYYDRFLFANPGITSIALCYDRCFCGKVLPHEAHDIQIKTTITETSLIRSENINGL